MILLRVVDRVLQAMSDSIRQCQCIITKTIASTNTARSNRVPFNSGWRRFGPQGEDITQYTPHYPDVPTVMWPTGVTTIAPFLPDEGEANEARNKLSWVGAYTSDRYPELTTAQGREICADRRAQVFELS